MSFYSNVTEQNLINLRILAEQQKSQREYEIENGDWKQTHGQKLAENLSPTTEKSDEINESTKKLGEVTEKTMSAIEINQEMVPAKIETDDVSKKSLPNNSTFSSIREMLGPLLNIQKVLQSTQDENGQAKIFSMPIQIRTGDKIKINDKFYDSTWEKYKALSPKSYTGKAMKNNSDSYWWKKL